MSNHVRVSAPNIQDHIDAQLLTEISTTEPGSSQYIYYVPSAMCLMLVDANNGDVISGIQLINIKFPETSMYK